MITDKLSKVFKILKSVFEWIITALALFGLYMFFVSNKKINNKEILNQEKKIKEKEKVSEIAEKKYKVSKEELQKIKEETEKILNEQEDNNEKIKVDSDTADNIINDILSGNR